MTCEQAVFACAQGDVRMTKDVILSATTRKNLTAIQMAEAKVARISEKMATGQRVNTIIDDPRNFTEASALLTRTKNLSRLLDGIGQNVRAIDVALSGTEAIYDMLDQAETVATDSLDKLLNNETDPKVVQQTLSIAGANLQDVIAGDNPVGYWRMDGNATSAGSTGGINGIPQNGVTFGGAPLYTKGGGPSAEFDGVNQGILIPDSVDINLANHPERTVELVFNADTVAGRQVLYEEGASVNAFTIYIDNGRLYAVGRDAGGWGPPNISVPINAGETYHVAFVFDWATTQRFEVYVDGASIGSVPVNANFPPHSGDIGIGYSPDSTWYHDGASGAPNYFDGRISDVALYNTAMTDADMQARVDAFVSSQAVRYINVDYQALIDEIDNLAEDAHYRGINLLMNDDMTTYFNETYTNSLLTEAEDFTVNGLGLFSFNFNDEDTVRDIIDRVQNAKERVRAFGTTILHDLSVIKARNVSIEQAINTHKAGAADLTEADLNEEGASMLAANTRLELSQAALALATEFDRAILSVLTAGQ